MDKVKKVVVSFSGGLDSTVLLYLMTKRYGKENVFALSFMYNQRHDIELYQAQKTSTRLGVTHKIFDISFLGEMASGVSSMVKGNVPMATAKDIFGNGGQPSSYMPNRNMILASLAAAFAETIEADAIAFGIQKIDSYSYWDTTLLFYQAMQRVLLLNAKNPICFLAPFVQLGKAEEISIGKELGVNFSETWTCYSPRIEFYNREVADPLIIASESLTFSSYSPCKNCPSCIERANAFNILNCNDPLFNGIIIPTDLSICAF